MVSAKNEEVLGIFDFVGEQEANGLQGLLATIDVIPEEKNEEEGRREGTEYYPRKR
jgi:hypothetical protein